MKAHLAGACALLLLLAVPQAAAPQADVPTWNVGDTWAMGAKDLDLTPLLQYIMENLQQQYATSGTSVDIDLTGTATVYEIFKVAEVQATQYKTEISLGLDMNFSGTVSATQYGRTESGNMNVSFILKADGFAYFDKDTLALAKEELSGDIDFIMHVQAAGQSADMRLDATFQTTMTFSPSLDIFDFPITVGENWTAESTVTLEGLISGTVSMTGYGEQSTTISLDNTVSVSISFECPSTTNVTLEDGSVSTCYKITQSGASVGDVAPSMLGGTIYYSPDRSFIVKQDLGGLPGAAGKVGGSSVGGIESTVSLGSLNPVTEQEARAAIAQMGAGGVNVVLLVVIGVIFLIIIAAVLVVRRRREQPEELLEVGYGHVPAPEGEGW